MEPLARYDQVHEYFNYDPDTGVMTWKKDRGRAKAGDVAGTVGTGGYLYLSFLGRRYTVHKLAWFYVYETWPDRIEHINKIPDDNRINNLVTLRDSW